MFKRFRSLHAWSGVLVLLALLLPSLAFAQSGPYTVPDSDLSKRIFIDYLFGPLTGKGDSPLTSVVFVLNSAVLFLGGIFAAYTIIAGTMSTAHDGQMLGQKWSSLWIPIRTTLGAAAVMPVIGGGWCAAQAIVVWLATMGVGIANTMWSAYTVDPLSDAIYAPPSMATQVHDVFGNMLMSNVCTYAYQKSFRDGESTALFDSASQTFGVHSDAFNGGNGYSYGTATEANRSYATCGKLDFTVSVEGQKNGGSGNNNSGEFVTEAGASLVDMPSIMTTVLPTLSSQIQSGQSTLEGLATRIVEKTATQADVNNTLDQLTANYVNAVSQAAQSAYQNSRNSNFQAQIQKDGWVTAGAFYMSIARAQDALTNAVTTLPTVSSPWSSQIQVHKEGSDDDSSWFSNAVDWVRSKASGVGAPSQTVQDSMISAWSMVRASRQATLGGVQFATEETSDSSSGSGLTNRFLGAFTSGMNGVTGSFETGSGYNQNPIIMAKNLGNSMVNWAWASLGIAVGIGLVGTIAAGSGVGGFIMFSGPFTMLFGTLLVAGASMTYYLPMLPFILWIGVVFGWAVLLVEAVIAAPLWAVVHMAPDADGVVGRGGQGYMLVLSLTLRPALMVLGLVAAISLMRPIGYLINSTFAGAFLLAQGPGASGVTGMIAGCAIYAGLMVTVINRVFGLIHVIPDRLLRWIGGGGGELGQEAGAIDQGSAGKMIAATQATRQLSETANNMTGQLAQRRAELLGRRASEAGAINQQVGNLEDKVARQDAASGKAHDRALNSDNVDDGIAAQDQGYALMAGGLDSARQQASFLAKSGGRGPDGRVTDEGKSRAEAAQQFLDAYNQAKETGGAGWESQFVQDQAKEATRVSSDTPSKVQPFHNSIIAAERGRQRANTNYREERAQNVNAARQAHQQANPASPPAGDDGTDAI